MDDNFSRQLDQHARSVNERLDRLLAIGPGGRLSCPPVLAGAMRHGVLNGGKRLRPFLLIESARLFDVVPADALEAACALECLHCYSLIHDDLPAMDDDDLRRGEPTVHRAYDEATAILAGDALLTLAFELLVDEKAHPDAAVRVRLVSLLATASGTGGMIGGQVLDLAAEQQILGEAEIRRLQSMKTGALIRYACEAGALIGHAGQREKQALVSYGEKCGTAFQLADDLLDVTSDSVTMGKATGKDKGRGKGTLVGVLGVERARELLSDTTDQAIAELDIFDGRADILRDTARFVARRTH